MRWDAVKRQHGRCSTLAILESMLIHFLLHAQSRINTRRPESNIGIRFRRYTSCFRGFPIAHLRVSHFIYLDRLTVRICSKLEEHLQLVQIVAFDGANEPGNQLVGDEMTAPRTRYAYVQIFI